MTQNPTNLEEKKTIRLEFSHVELLEDDTDYSLKRLPFSYLTKMMMKANEIGLEGKKIEVVEVSENFATSRKYIDFIVTPSNHE